VGLVASLTTGHHESSLRVDTSSPARGFATSGWGGRSFSLGIADAVTAVATSTAVADVAASLIANAVDLPGHPSIERRPACVLDPDSDLGDRLVTTAVRELTDKEVGDALDRGTAEAGRLLAQVPELLGAVLALRGRSRMIGEVLDGLERTKQEAAHAT
jgi:ApbE superfamily uncharacterized protein (UPF0280 family)